MNELKRDLVGKLAWNIVRMEFAEERKDLERLAQLSSDFDQLVVVLNSICNPHLMMVLKVDGSEKDSYQVGSQPGGSSNA